MKTIASKNICADPLCDFFFRDELISTRFTGSTGRAFLFKRVVNLSHSEVSERIMLTGKCMKQVPSIKFKIYTFVFKFAGKHWVRDVFCKKCNYKLGNFCIKSLYQCLQHYIIFLLQVGCMNLLLRNSRGTKSPMLSWKRP